MENLLKIGLSQNIIDSMIEVNGIFDVEELNENINNTNKILSVLKQLRIEKDIIDILLVHHMSLFLMKYDTFLLKIKDCNLREVSQRINEDVDSVDDIFFKE